MKPQVCANLVINVWCKSIIYRSLAYSGSGKPRGFLKVEISPLLPSYRLSNLTVVQNVSFRLLFLMFNLIILLKLPLVSFSLLLVLKLQFPSSLFPPISYCILSYLQLANNCNQSLGICLHTFISEMVIFTWSQLYNHNNIAKIQSYVN